MLQFNMRVLQSEAPCNLLQLVIALNILLLGWSKVVVGIFRRIDNPLITLILGQLSFEH